MGKIRKAVVYCELSNIINNGCLPGRLTFKLVEPEPGKRQVIQITGQNVARFVDPGMVVNAVLEYCVNAGEFDFMTHKDAVECVKFWTGITRPIPMPKYLGERDELDVCFHRLSFNYFDTPKPTLVIDEFLSRCSNSDAIRAWIGSLTVENSSRFQYLWVYGSGGEGKGSFARGLIEIFGTGAVSMPVPKTDSQKQFMAFSVQGKRLCIFPECENFNFPQDPLFKQFTGGDHVWIEQKGKMGHSSPISAKFLFLSNTRPGVGGNDANLRRMIYSEIDKPTVKYAPQIYDSLIKTEMPSFIIKCRELYLKLCPNNETIEFEDEKSTELIELNEERWQGLTDNWLEIGADKTATAAQMVDLCKRAGINHYDYRAWLEYLRAKVGAKSVNKRWDGKKMSRRWQGFAPKPMLSLVGSGV